MMGEKAWEMEVIKWLQYFSKHWLICLNSVPLMSKPRSHSFIKLYMFSAVDKTYLTDKYLKNNPIRWRCGKAKGNIYKPESMQDGGIFFFFFREIYRTLQLFLIKGVFQSQIFETALLRYNLCTIQFTQLRGTVQWHLVYSQCSVTITTGQF